MTPDQLREMVTNWAHTAAALVGAVSAILGVITAALNTAPHSAIPQSVSAFLLIAGSAVALASKLIDSANNALTAKSIVVHNVPAGSTPGDPAILAPPPPMT